MKNTDNSEIVLSKGMTNLGNTCFFNATIQVIFSLDLLVDLLTQNAFDKNKQFFLLALKNLFLNYNDSSKKYCNPISFIQTIKHKIKMFNGKQQDAVCFLGILLEYITKEAKEVFELFDIKLKDIVMCSGCNTKSYNSYSATILYLDINESISNSIDNYLNKTDTGKFYKCNNCNQITDFSINREIVYTSVYYIIHLNRYSSSLSKNSKCVKIEQKIRINNQPYKLVGVICHSGSLNSGHYWSYGCRNEKFCKFNDLFIGEVENTDLFSDKPYAVFYQQVGITTIDL